MLSLLRGLHFSVGCHGPSCRTNCHRTTERNAEHFRAALYQRDLGATGVRAGSAECRSNSALAAVFPRMGQTVRATSTNRSSGECQHHRDAGSRNFRPTAPCLDALISNSRFCSPEARTSPFSPVPASPSAHPTRKKNPAVQGWAAGDLSLGKLGPVCTHSGRKRTQVHLRAERTAQPHCGLVISKSCCFSLASRPA